METYTYTSTTTNANGNVISETKKSSTQNGGTEKIKYEEKYPYVTYNEDNKVLDRERYVGEPGKVEDRGNAIGVQTLEPGKNKRKDTGVLNMSEKNFSLLDLLYNKGKGLPNSREDTQKVLFKNINKENLTASDMKEVFKVINSKPTKAELERHRYYGKKVDSFGNPKENIGKKVGDAVSGRESRDMAQIIVPLSSNSDVTYPVDYRRNLFGKVKATYRADKPSLGFEYTSSDGHDRLSRGLASIDNVNLKGLTDDDLALAIHELATKYPDSRFKLNVKYPVKG